MTITYTREVANSRLGGFSNLLLRWRGSVYKLFYKEFIIYITLYTLISICYRSVDNKNFKEYFEKLCLQFQTYTDLVPISFVLGFYVSVVVTRWWQQFSSIPWPDRTMMLVASNVHGSDHRGRLIRRTLMRYLSLAEVLTYRSISTAVFKRFPTMQHVIEAGFMTPLEYKEYERVKTDNVKYFVPLLWFASLLSKARQEGRIYDDITYQNILKEMNDFRSCCGTLFGYDWISIPLVYTQVVTVAVYVFFLSTLLSRQYLDVSKEFKGHEVDLYVPIFTIFQFFFYFGWLKVAEQLINPFGEDDDDFEMNMIIDRNIEISLLGVDRLYFTHPKLEKDMYWNNPNPNIPYTAASANHKVDAFIGSTMDMSLDVEDMRFVNNLGPVTESEWELGHDYNHNRVDTTVSMNMAQSPPSYARVSKGTKKAPATGNPINFWLKHIATEGDDEDQKISLLEKDGLFGHGAEDLTEQVKDEGEEYGLEISDDEDSTDSDIGDGGGSEDEGTEDGQKSRRSSLSSIDDENIVEPSPKTDTDGPTPQPIRKHTIEDPDDKPIAKKPKSTPGTAGDNGTTTLPSNKKRKQGPLKQNFSEGNLKSLGSRFTFGKGRKSPKRKMSAPKPARKMSDFGLALFGKIDDERHNAQIRNFNLQRNVRRKSAIALQRNARRVKYPGNTWLRHKNPLLQASDMSTVDYASMTSGGEEKHDFDSPFGSVNSFATSVPSPRPLRFSHFGKRGNRIHLESMCSSCMTSPGVHDEFTPTATFANATLSKQPREESNGTVPMPFTEDLRRRLRVVSASSPASSKATSPLLMRSQFGAQPSPYRPNRSSVSETDDHQFPFPTFGSHANVSSNVQTLESIGEITHRDRINGGVGSQSSGVNHSTVSNKDESDLNNFVAKLNVPSLQNSAKKASSQHPGVNRSRSCPLPVNTLALSVPASQPKKANSQIPAAQDDVQRIDPEICPNSPAKEFDDDFANGDGIILRFPSAVPDARVTAGQTSKATSSQETAKESQTKTNSSENLSANQQARPSTGSSYPFNDDGNASSKIQTKESKVILEDSGITEDEPDSHPSNNATVTTVNEKESSRRHSKGHYKEPFLEDRSHVESTVIATHITTQGSALPEHILVRYSNSKLSTGNIERATDRSSIDSDPPPKNTSPQDGDVVIDIV